MRLRGQPGFGANGYAMVALLVAMSVMGILMSAVLPAWKTMATREKEAELIFRGEQYRRAIGLFQRRNGPGTLPPSIDVLVEQRFLRRKYKDPITNDDFDPIVQGQTALGAATPGTVPGADGRGQAPSGRGAPQAQPPAGRGAGQTFGTPSGGILGVMSKSKAQSIRLYNGRNHYNEWQFIYVPQAPAAGQGGAPGGPDGRGGRGGPGAPGTPGVGGRDGRGGRGQTPSGQTPPGGRDGRGGFQITPFGRDSGRGQTPPRRP